MPQTRDIPDNVTQSPSSIDMYKDIVYQMFSKLGYNIHQDPAPEDFDLRDKMERAFKLDELSPAFRQSVLRPFQIGYDCGNIVYRNWPAEVRLYIGIFTTLIIYAEDENVPNRVEKLQGFAEKLAKNEPHGDPHYDHLAHLIANDTSKSFGPFATSCIIKSTIDMVATSGVEFQYPNGFPSMSKQLPAWFRRKTGNGEAYAFFLYPNVVFPENKRLGDYLAVMPVVGEWIDLVNDVLSFYKERVVGAEDNCYITNNAGMLDITEIEALKLSVERIGILHDRIMAVVSRDKALLRSWTDFENGYILFHFTQKRYRLREVLQ